MARLALFVFQTPTQVFKSNFQRTTRVNIFRFLIIANDFKSCIIWAIRINSKFHKQSLKIMKIWNSAYACLLNPGIWRVLQTESQEMECQMKKVFSIFLAWAKRELFRSYSISEPMKLQNLPTSTSSRPLFFSSGNPSIVNRSVSTCSNRRRFNFPQFSTKALRSELFR